MSDVLLDFGRGTLSLPSPAMKEAARQRLARDLEEASPLGLHFTDCEVQGFTAPVPLPARRCPPARPKAKPQGRLRTDDLFARIDQGTLMEVLNLSRTTLSHWGTFVPRAREEFLRGLMEHWPLLAQVRRLRRKGYPLNMICHELKKDAATLGAICRQYNLSDWPQ